jgi:hypothetical protein
MKGERKLRLVPPRAEVAQPVQLAEEEEVALPWRS